MKIGSDSEFLKFALSKYDNPQLMSLQDFESDVRRFVQVNVLLNKYREDKTDVRERLIVNHLIILSNCFSVSGILPMLSYKVSSHNKQALNTFLYYLNFIEKSETDLDFYLLDILNEI